MIKHLRVKSTTIYGNSTSLILFHGSPYSNVDVKKASLLYYTQSLKVAEAYARKQVSFAGKAPVGFKGEEGPTIYTVRASGVRAFDLRRPDHQSVYEKIRQEWNSKTSDVDDRLPRLDSPGFIHSHSGLPGYGNVPVIVSLLKHKEFDAIWVDEVSQGVSLAVFNSKPIHLIEKKSC